MHLPAGTSIASHPFEVPFQEYMWLLPQVKIKLEGRIGFHRILSIGLV